MATTGGAASTGSIGGVGGGSGVGGSGGFGGGGKMPPGSPSLERGKLPGSPSLERGKLPGSPTMKRNYEKQLTECLKLLKGETDEEKFVGLVLVTKVVSPLADNEADIKKVFDAIGFDFINRMLISDKEVVSEVAGFSFKSLALNILSSFCCYTELAQHEQMLSKVHLLLNMLEQSNDAGMVADTWRCLEGISATQKGVFTLYDTGIVNTLASVLAKTTEESKITYYLNFLQHLINTHTPAYTQIFSTDILSQISRIVKERQDMSKFLAVDVLLSVLLSVEKKSENTAIEKNTPQWTVNVADGVFSILSSKVGAKQREPAIMVCGLMLDYFGQSWPLSISKGPQFVDFLIQIVRIEIRLYLETHSENSPKTEEGDSKTVFVLMCYRIIENAICYLSDDSDGSNAVDKRLVWVDQLTPDILKRVNEAFLDVFGNILGFLLTAEKNTKFVESSVRLLGCWLSEETEALREELKNALPKILTIIHDSYDDTLLVQFLPALMEVTADETTRKIFIESSGDTIVRKYVEKNCVQLLTQLIHENGEQQISSSDVLVNSLSVLLNLVYLEKTMKQRVAIDCLPLLPVLSACMKDCANLKAQQQPQIKLFGYFVGLSLSIMQHFSQHTITIPEKTHHQTHNVVDDLCGFVGRFFEVAVLLVEKEGLQELWEISVNVLSECLPRYPALQKRFEQHSAANELKHVLEKLSLKNITTTQHK